MSTTSKLGADMTDFQINLLASHYWEIKEVMGVRTDKFDAVGFARALLARQPAAIDKQDERGDSPLSLIPELVKQDQCAVGDALLDMGDAMVAWRTEVGKYREITSLAQSAFSDGYEAGIAAILRARAASTSANVAQNELPAFRAIASALFHIDVRGVSIGDKAIIQAAIDALNSANVAQGVEAVRTNQERSER